MRWVGRNVLSMIQWKSGYVTGTFETESIKLERVVLNLKPAFSLDLEKRG